MPLLNDPTVINPVNYGPVQLIEEDEDELDEDNDWDGVELPKRTRNRRLERNLRRAGRRADRENYREME